MLLRGGFILSFFSFFFLAMKNFYRNIFRENDDVHRIWFATIRFIVAFICVLAFNRPIELEEIEPKKCGM